MAGAAPRFHSPSQSQVTKKQQTTALAQKYDEYAAVFQEAASPQNYLDIDFISLYIIYVCQILVLFSQEQCFFLYQSIHISAKIPNQFT